MTIRCVSCKSTLQKELHHKLKKWEVISCRACGAHMHVDGLLVSFLAISMVLIPFTFPYISNKFIFFVVAIIEFLLIALFENVKMLLPLKEV